MKNSSRILPVLSLLLAAIAGFGLLSSCGGGAGSPPAAPAGSHTLADFTGEWLNEDALLYIEVGSDGASIVHFFVNEVPCVLTVDSQGAGTFSVTNEMTYVYNDENDEIIVDSGFAVFSRKPGTSGTTLVGEWVAEPDEGYFIYLTVNAGGTWSSIDSEDDEMGGTYDEDSLTMTDELARASVDTEVEPNTMTFNQPGVDPIVLQKTETIK